MEYEMPYYPIHTSYTLVCRCIPVGDISDTVNVSSNSGLRSSATLRGSATKLVPSGNVICPFKEDRSLREVVTSVTVYLTATTPNKPALLCTYRKLVSGSCTVN